MADSVRLHELVGAVAGAIVDAQGLVEQRYIHQVSSYFDGQGNPLCLAVKMPRPGGAGSDEMQIAVPLLSLAESAMLAIKDLKIELDVELGGIIDGTAASASASAAPQVAQVAASLTPPPFRSGGAPIDVPGPPSNHAAGGTAGPTSQPAAPIAQPALHPDKMLTLSLGTTSASGPKARLSINVAAKPPPEAMLRLITQLNKLV